MKKGINFWAFGNKSISESFKIAKKLGFDGVELTLDEKGEITPETPDSELLQIKELAKKEDIELYSLATGLYWKYSLTDNDENVREKARFIAKRQLEIASLLGCNSVLIVGGSVNESTSYLTVYNRSIEAMNYLKPIAEKLKVNIGVENVWSKFLLSPIEFRDYLDKINSKYVGAYFDVGNCVYDGYPEHWIEILGERIKKVHYKDFVRDKRNYDGFVDLLKGNVNFKTVNEALEKIGYGNDFATAEVFPNDEKDDVVERASLAYKTIFKN